MGHTVPVSDARYKRLLARVAMAAAVTPGPPPVTLPLIVFAGVGDNVADDTAALQTALNAASAIGTGTTVLVKPPAVSYKLTASVTVPRGVQVVGLSGMGSPDYPVFTQWTYGATIFTVGGSAPHSGDHVTIRDLSGQYGPTTFGSGPDVPIGSTSFTPASTAGIAANDWLILDQYPNLEQVQVLSVVGPTVNLQTATTIDHTGAFWVRDQATVSGPLVFNSPPRDIAGFANLTNGNDCLIEDCGVLAMVTGVKFRGVPSSNSQNNSGNTVSKLSTNFVQYGCLAQQQTNFRNLNPTYRNATGGQAGAPGHGLYMTGLTGPGPAWSNATTYALYQQVYFGSVQYISLAAGNVAHQPDVSPTFWSAQTVPSASTGWRSKNRNLTVTGVYANSGLNFKDWSGVKVKFTDVGTVTGTTIESCVRGFDFQEFNDACVSGFSAKNFIPPISFDSSAAAVDALNCNGLSVVGGTVDLTQSGGGSIDMPIVLDRLDGTTDPVTGRVLGADNLFAQIQGFSNYSGAFTSAAYRTQTRRTVFGECKLKDVGGTNVEAFLFSQNVTAATFADGCQLVLPTLEGTNKVASVTAGTGAGADGPVVINLDNNMVPASPVLTDPGGGAILTNAYVTNVGGTLGLSPQSPTADVLSAQAPASATFKWWNFRGSAGNAEISATTGAASGLKVAFDSSFNAEGAFVSCGFNLTAGFPTSGTVLGGFCYRSDNISAGITGAGFFGIANENQNAGALGLDLLFQSVTAGGTTPYKNLRLFGSGDVLVNATGAPLATTATTGFLFVPSMAGIPTGIVPGHTGASGIVFDTTSGRLWVNKGSANWTDVAAETVAASGPANGTAFKPGSIQRVSAGQSGFAYTLPDATTCPGSTVTFKCTNNGGLYTFTLTDAGGHTIDGATSYVVVSQQSQGDVIFESDGTNWQIVGAYNGRSLYVEDFPTYHGLLEWVGNPAFFQGTGAATTGVVNVVRLLALNAGSVSNILVHVPTAGVGPTAATTTNITGAANNGSGAIRLTVASSAAFATNDVASAAGVVGTVEANAGWKLTVVDGTHIDLQGSTFTNAYVSGGVLTRSPNVAAIYDSAGNFLGCTGDQGAAWTSTGLKTMALAAPVTLTRGSVYYVVLLTNYGTTQAAFASGATQALANAGLGNNAQTRWSANGTGATQPPSSINPTANTTATAGVRSWWVGLS